MFRACILYAKYNTRHRKQSYIILNIYTYKKQISLKHSPLNNEICTL
jgi:hypothetical protein